MTAWCWPPCNPLSAAQALASINPDPLGSIALSDVNGALQVVAAAPTGYVRFIGALYVRNRDAVLALDWSLADSNGVCSAGLALAAGGQATSLAPSVPTPLVGACTITISGAGGHADVYGWYYDLPQPAGYIQTAVALTVAFQAIPTIIPTANAAVPQWTNLQGWVNGLIVMWNGDTASSTAQYRLTRATKQYLFNAGAIGVRGRGLIFAMGDMPLLPGDTLEVRSLVAPTTTSPIVRHVYLAVGALS